MRTAAASTRLDTTALIERLTPRAQVIVFSPLCDDVPVETVQTLQAAGHAVRVCTPDVTATTSPGATLAGIERGTRCAALRTVGVTVIDWDPSESLAVVLERTARGMVARLGGESGR